MVTHYNNNTFKIAHKRILWLDMIKGYSMIFVMLHHITFTPSIYRMCYAPFFLTAFFVSAGFTFHSENDFVGFLFRKIKALLIPWLVLGIICILSSQLLTFNQRSNFVKEICNLLMQNGTGGHRLWFIAAMFVTCCMFYPVSKIKNKIWSMIVIALLAVGNILFCKYIWDRYLPWHISVVGMACFWMGVGYLTKEYINIEDLVGFFQSRKVVIIVSILYILFQCMSIYIFDTDYVSFSDFTEDPVLYFILNTLGVILIACISNLRHFKLLSKFLIFIGQNTLFYFAFHGKVQSVIMKIIGLLGVSSTAENYGIFFAPAISVLEAIILILPCALFSMCFPFAVGKTKYNRKV